MTLFKLAAVALAMLAGSLVGKFIERPRPMAPQTGAGSKLQPANPSEGSELIASEPTESEEETIAPERSPLAEAIDFERHLATCDLQLFPSLMEKALAGIDPWRHSSKIMEVWMRRDRDACTAWVASQPAYNPIGASGNTSINLRSNLIQQIANQDPEAAWLTADQLRAGENSKYDILDEVLIEDPEKALALAIAHPEVMITGIAFRSDARAGFAPMQSIPIIEALHPGGARNSIANDGINHYLTHPDDLAEASDWFTQLPPETRRFVVNRLERNLFESRLEVNLSKLREIWTLPDQPAATPD